MQNNRNSGQNLTLYIFECVMAVLYLAISYAFLFTSLFIDAVSSKDLRLSLGILLGIYGVFRVFRVVRKYLQRNKSDE